MSDYTFWRPHNHKAASSTSLSFSWIPIAWHLMTWRINQLLPILYPSQSTPELSKVEGGGGRPLLSYGHWHVNFEFQRVFQLSWECSLILSMFIKNQSQGSFSHDTLIPSSFFLSQMLCVARVDPCVLLLYTRWRHQVPGLRKSFPWKTQGLSSPVDERDLEAYKQLSLKPGDRVCSSECVVVWGGWAILKSFYFEGARGMTQWVQHVLFQQRNWVLFPAPCWSVYTVPWLWISGLWRLACALHLHSRVHNIPHTV